MANRPDSLDLIIRFIITTQPGVLIIPFFLTIDDGTARQSDDGNVVLQAAVVPIGMNTPVTRRRHKEPLNVGVRLEGGDVVSAKVDGHIDGAVRAVSGREDVEAVGDKRASAQGFVSAPELEAQNGRPRELVAACLHATDDPAIVIPADGRVTTTNC